MSVENASLLEEQVTIRRVHQEEEYLIEVIQKIRVSMFQFNWNMPLSSNKIIINIIIRKFVNVIWDILRVDKRNSTPVMIKKIGLLPITKYQTRFINV